MSPSEIVFFISTIFFDFSFTFGWKVRSLYFCSFLILKRCKLSFFSLCKSLILSWRGVWLLYPKLFILGFRGTRLYSLVFGWKLHSFISSMSWSRRIFSRFSRRFSTSAIKRSYMGAWLKLLTELDLPKWWLLFSELFLAASFGLNVQFFWRFSISFYALY